jgi:hypothetical protein
MQELYNEAYDDAIQKVIDLIENANLTDGVHTTFDQSMMRNCKYEIIMMIKEHFYGNGPLPNTQSGSVRN